MDCEAVNFGVLFMHGFTSGIILQLVFIAIGWIFSADRSLGQVTR